MSDELFKKAIKDFKAAESDYEKRIKAMGEFNPGEKEKELEALYNEHVPIKFRDANPKDLNPILSNFLFNKELTFCWIYGGTGTGKTFELYKLKKWLIKENMAPLRIINETDLNHEKNTSGFIAIDDVGLSNNLNRANSLIELYYSIISKKYENEIKMIFTSNFSVDQWLKNNLEYNPEICARIGSRMSNNRLEILLQGKDRRKYPDNK